MLVILTHYTSQPFEAIEEAVANCYKTMPNEKAVDACYQSGHTSELEFATFQFHIEDVSRALLAQLTRHRLASFSVQSQRYVNKSNFPYYTPSSILDNLQNREMYDYLMKEINDTYDNLLLNGVSKEDARMVLPNACYTELDMSINLRSLMNFMSLRLCTRAQDEIRELANRMKNEIIQIEPKFSKYLVPKCEAHYPYCFCTENKSCGKHKTLKEVYHA